MAISFFWPLGKIEFRHNTDITITMDMQTITMNTPATSNIAINPLIDRPCALIYSYAGSTYKLSANDRVPWLNREIWKNMDDTSRQQLMKTGVKICGVEFTRNITDEIKDRLCDGKFIHSYQNYELNTSAVRQTCIYFMTSGANFIICVDSATNITYWKITGEQITVVAGQDMLDCNGQDITTTISAPKITQMIPTKMAIITPANCAPELLGPCVFVPEVEVMLFATDFALCGLDANITISQMIGWENGLRKIIFLPIFVDFACNSATCSMALIMALVQYLDARENDKAVIFHGDDRMALSRVHARMQLPDNRHYIGIFVPAIARLAVFGHK